MAKNKYHVVRIPKVAYNAIQLIQTEILIHGIAKIKSPWIKDLLSSGRLPPSKGDIFGISTICLALIIGDKTKEEINQMSKNEVVAFLKDNGYTLPTKWSC